MPKTKLFNEDDVLSKALDIFWKKGYYATSMQDLVNHLGISRSSLYSIFECKRTLFDKALEQYCSINKNDTREFLQNQKNVKAGLSRLFEIAISESISDIDRKGCFVVNTTTELISRDRKIQDVLAENRSDFEEIFHEFLLSGKKSGEISKEKNLDVIASLIYTFYSGIKVVAKIEPDRKKLNSSVSILLSLLN